MILRRLFFLGLLLTTACGIRPPIRHALSIEPAEGGAHATLTLVTELETDGSESAAVKARVNQARADIVDGRDAWTQRFAGIQAERERITLDRVRGVLERAERSATIETSQLQRFFADTGITLSISRRDGWSELDLYPPASTRATRQQRERVLRALSTWSRDAVAYFRAVDGMYAYINVHPHRADAMFAALFDNDAVVTEEEEAFAAGVSKAMEKIIQHMDAAEGDTFTLDEEFDLVFNPLPAEISVRTPTPIDHIEGFEQQDERSAVIRRRGIFDAIRALEGRWISPDPLAILLRSEYDKKDPPPPAELAAVPRRSDPSVTSEEVSAEFGRYFAPQQTYRLRWRD
ncbi:MAG: hypothetical protein ACXW28_10880 [Thermoanaerobaculia bacterium]